VNQSSASKEVNPKAEGSTELEAVTKKPLVKKQKYVVKAVSRRWKVNITSSGLCPMVISRAEPLGPAIKVFVSEQFLADAVAGLGRNLVP
jgi:hypothetical protein